MQQNDDLKYIQSIRRGNHHVYRQIVDKYKNKVFGLCLGILKNEEEAKDASQEAFVKVYEKLDQFRGHSLFSTWLYKIAYRICLNKIRSEKRKPIKVNLNNEAFDIEETTNLYDQVEKADKKLLLNKAIEQLNDDERQMLVLYYFQELDIAEIRKVTGMSKSNVKIKLFRARKRLLYMLNRLLKGEIESLVN